MQELADGTKAVNNATSAVASRLLQRTVGGRPLVQMTADGGVLTLIGEPRPCGGSGGGKPLSLQCIGWRQTSGCDATGMDISDPPSCVDGCLLRDCQYTDDSVSVPNIKPSGAYSIRDNGLSCHRNTRLPIENARTRGNVYICWTACVSYLLTFPCGDLHRTTGHNLEPKNDKPCSEPIQSGIHRTQSACIYTDEQNGSCPWFLLLYFHSDTVGGYM
jgi:hypothetical protein